MIEKVENLSDLDLFVQDDLFYIRIMSIASAYGFSYDFATFYRQVDSSGKITSIISKLDNDFTLCKNEFADNEELAEFFSVIGFSSLLSDETFDFHNNFDEGIIMSTCKKVEFVMPYVEIDRFPKLMKLFNFIDYDNADFESWYVDISHRIRHNCAKAYSLNMNDEIISSGIFSSIYNNDAILSSVQTLYECRRIGYASCLISEMMSDIKGKIYLMREKNLNEKFYLNLGFENTGKWRIHK